MKAGKAPNVLVVTQLSKISLVMVNFNMASEIAGMLTSFLAHNHPRSEIIIIDGASMDGREVKLAMHADWKPNRTIVELNNMGRRFDR